jgi:uncharacterized protein YraI
MNDKKVVVFAVLIFATLNIYSQEEYMYVEPNEGLNIRFGPGTRTEKIGYLKQYSQVSVLEYGPIDIIDNIESTWVKIDFNGIIGWVFKGYLMNKNGYVA